jgi:hypothetical protein
VIPSFGSLYTRPPPRPARKSVRASIFAPIATFSSAVAGIYGRLGLMRPCTVPALRLSCPQIILPVNIAALATPVMSQKSTSATAASSTPDSELRFQTIFQAAVESYRKQTKKDLFVHPLASQLESCDSTTAICALLQDQLREFDRSQSGDERLTKWLGPTVNVLCAFSATVSGGVSLVSLYTQANVDKASSDADILYRYFRLPV